MTPREIFALIPPKLAFEILEFAHSEDRDVYHAALQAVAQARKVRVVFLERQPRVQRHAGMVSLLSRPALAAVADTLLRTWLLKKYAGMLADFLDGMFDACPATTHIVDAWEGAYTYKKPSQYQNAYESIKVKLAERAADPEKYRRHFSAGFGIWMDCNWRQAGWHTDDSAKNFHPPADFEASVRQVVHQGRRFLLPDAEHLRDLFLERHPRQKIVDSLVDRSCPIAIRCPFCTHAAHRDAPFVF